MKTANGQYDDNDEYVGLKLSEWAQRCHKHLSQHSGWYYSPLQQGQFGYDNMLVSVGHCLENMDFETGGFTAGDLAPLVHDGWCLNFRYWCDNKPWTTGAGGVFKKPKKTLNDKRRDECLRTEYTDLPDDEKDKDLIVAEEIISILNEQGYA